MKRDYRTPRPRYPSPIPPCAFIRSPCPPKCGGGERSRPRPRPYPPSSPPALGAPPLANPYDPVGVVTFIALGPLGTPPPSVDAETGVASASRSAYIPDPARIGAEGPAGATWVTAAEVGCEEGGCPSRGEGISVSTCTAILDPARPEDWRGPDGRRSTGGGSASLGPSGG